MKLMVTGFMPFGGERVNPSWEAARAAKAPAGTELIKCEICVEYIASGNMLLSLLLQHRPDAVLMLGQAGSSASVAVERVALNLIHSEAPDNSGAVFMDTPVITGGPCAYFSTVDTFAAVSALRENGIPARESLSAGAYVCNSLFYRALDFSIANPWLRQAGFTHVPLLPGQAPRGDRATMALETIVKAVETELAYIAGSL